jgi:uncharacterized membrane protein YqaE (UPF0057 family)
MDAAATPVQRARRLPWAVVAAILLPPLGVWLSEGATLNFWLTALLTLLAFVPGVLFALVVVLKPGLIRLR